jgi:hemolysin D
VLNRDIGFVRAGQDAQIKIDTFNFSRYGLLHGKVLSVSPDAITHDKPQDKSGNDEGTWRMQQASRKAMNWSMRRASHSITNKCRWMTD